jgi:hypothetical protein
MTVGSLAGAGCVFAWSQVHTPIGLYAVFAGIGIAGAAVHYEPAFATVNAFFDATRREALLTIMVVAGFASTIFLPASAPLRTTTGTYTPVFLALGACALAAALSFLAADARRVRTRRVRRPR